ncbi:hypothetical protein ACVW1A_007899 [Bradyrhizobium sp. LB1.3]
MRCYIFTLDYWGKTLDVQEIECGSAEEALQLGSAGVANEPIEVWCGPRSVGLSHGQTFLTALRPVHHPWGSPSTHPAGDDCLPSYS